MKSVKFTGKMLLFALAASLYTLYFIPYTSSVEAQARGLGVTPSRLEISQAESWPHTVEITVFNFSERRELFEVGFEKDASLNVISRPETFVLEPDSKRSISVTFSKPNGVSSGVVLILTSRTSPDGLGAGTGMKIPFEISGNALLAGSASNTGAANVAGAFEMALQYPWVIGGLALFFVLAVVGYVAFMQRRLFAAAEEEDSVEEEEEYA